MSETKSMAEKVLGDVMDNQTQPSAGNAEAAVVKLDGSKRAEHVHTITYDRVYDVLTFDGFKFSGELMRQFTETPCGRMFRVVERRDGLVTVSQEHHPLSFAAPDMLAALKTVTDHLHIAMNVADASKQASAIMDAFDAASAALTKAEPST